ncbi:hypothetical protein FOPG_03852 [Fusarium oxysporum f. sp. conglutinans race 2 54008]|uniref:Uncharacterized protein n=3 Tax=Fusarium oxysporum f. sp. conglutinans TaxID=100902 RepID=A0A8H6GK73_FUSOX|nr:hypothetical protein FOXB_13736 [Fusarium oxysporum f. sp. conglutinans Fo5176]EXL83251.1 hypothetical protein FOPG_03852 [Fusarium oxysporum f. sp. conglutinans race 2 54008]KAF6518966.1 hypothetical protein HZS61_017340 [Fusarium oxysporum f. sp. conglutinans]KAG6985992.1 hypothetical protein FocnCong_v004323 [Fusarium oxysporum f. sp. conglutinans]KAI8405091.1 hypothetical protein FOFC_14570 [Fusarium oxysporum]
MSNRKIKRPSHFCEWVVGTTIESVIGAIPQNKPPKKRDVVRVQVTTDDESEEDTVKITYPRTGRTYTPPPANEAKAEAKKVRFNFGQNGPIKSAMKQTTTTTPMDSSDEASASGPETESDSSQSAYISSSDATDSDIEYSVECVKHRRQKKKKHRQTQTEEDTESDWDSDPEPTCDCLRCQKGRQILKRVGRKRSKEITPPSPETSESDEEESPNTKRQSGKNKRRCRKKAKPTEPDPNTSNSDPESEIPAPKKRNQTKNQGKQRGGKKKQAAPQPPMTKKQRKAMNKKAKQQQEQEIEGETSDSPKEAEEETEPEEEPEKQNKGKQKNNKKQDEKQAKQKKQEPEKATHKDPEAVEQTPTDEAPEASKDKDQGKFRTMKGKAKAQPKQKDGVKKGNYPEGLLVPHMRRPQLIEPIRAQVVQTERVIKTPQDPAPNAYYDAEHNIMRVYQGPAYGNHQNNALYPERDAFTCPLPMGQPHPMQNPFYYSFNNTQQYPNYPQMPPFHQGYAGIPPPEAYSHVPITQGMAPPPWYAMGPPPGVPPTGYYGHRSPETNKNTPASKTEKDKASQNNVGPPGSLTGQNNPYYKRKSQNNTCESHRSVSKENSQPPGSDKAGSNGSNGWNNGSGDNNGQNGQDGWGAPTQDNNQNGDGWNTSNNQAVDDWNKTTQDSKPEEWVVSPPSGEQDQNQNGWGAGSNHSNKSNETVKRNGDHWGDDTFPGARGDWSEQPTISSVGQGADNNVGIWAPTDVNGNEDGNQKPPSAEGEGRDNIMPGTWVDTPGVTMPTWGDPTAARDTNGEASNW